jgi:hypothetical protein
LVACPPTKPKMGGSNSNANRNFCENTKNILSVEFELTMLAVSIDCSFLLPLWYSTIDGYSIRAHMFLTVVIIWVNVLRSASTLACLRKLCKQPLNRTSLLNVVQYEALNTHKTMDSQQASNSDMPLFRGRLLYHLDTSKTSETIRGDKLRAGRTFHS